MLNSIVSLIQETAPDVPLWVFGLEVLGSVIVTVMGLWQVTSRTVNKAIRECQQANKATIDKLTEIIEELSITAKRQERLLEQIKEREDRVEVGVNRIVGSRPCAFNDISAAKALTDTIAEDVVSKIDKK